MPHLSLSLKTAFLSAALLASTGTTCLAGTIYDTLKSNPQFSILAKAIDANGMKDQYTESEARTVFAPTDDAFARLDGGYKDLVSPNAPADKENVRALLLYQIVPGRHTPESLKGKSVSVTTMQTSKAAIDGSGAQLKFGDGKYGATQSGAAITASNGIIIPIDSLPRPVFSETSASPQVDNAPVPPPHKGVTQTPNPSGVYVPEGSSATTAP